MAERVGFEPTDRCRSTVFETARFGHSRTSPYIGKLSVHRGGLILPEPLKKSLQKVATFVFQYAGRDGDLVIQAGILMEPEQGPAGPGFGVPGAEDQTRNSRLQHGAGTHEAGFQRHIEGCAS